MNHFNYEDNLTDFIDDVCIAVAGKVRQASKQYLSAEECLVVNQARSRLVGRGTNLIRQRAAQMQYDGLKSQANTLKQTCLEDGIPVKD